MSGKDQHQDQSDCPTCGNTSFDPTATGELGPLYYYLAKCTGCGALVQRCVHCGGWNPREHGVSECPRCNRKYQIPTEDEEQRRLEDDRKSFLFFQPEGDPS